MKFELEISNEKVQAVIDQQVSSAISAMTGRYGSQDEVSRAVKKHWDSMLEDRIKMRLADSKEMSRMIDEAVAAKVKAQLNKLLKAVV